VGRAGANRGRVNDFYVGKERGAQKIYASVSVSFVIERG